MLYTNHKTHRDIWRIRTTCPILLFTSLWITSLWRSFLAPQPSSRHFQNLASWESWYTRCRMLWCDAGGPGVLALQDWQGWQCWKRQGRHGTYSGDFEGETGGGVGGDNVWRKVRSLASVTVWVSYQRDGMRWLEGRPGSILSCECLVDVHLSFSRREPFYHFIALVKAQATEAQ